MRTSIFHGSIRKKLALLFLLSALPAFLVILFFGLKASNESTAAAERNLKHFTKELADTQARTTASVKLLLETLAKVPEVRQAKAAACVELFASLIKEHPQLTTINLVGLSGDLIASATGARSANFAHTKHFQNALKLKRFATGEYLVGVTVKVPAFAFAYPLLDAQGQPKYFLLTSIRLDIFDRQFEKMSFPADSFVGACDHRGLRLYRHPSNNEVPLGQPIRQRVFEAVSANSEGLIEDIGSDGVTRIVAYSAIRLSPDEPPYMYVFSGVPKSAIMTKSRSELIDNMGLFLSAVALALLSGWFFGGRALGMKLEKMAAAANRIGAGDHSVRVALDTDITEIATLAKSFNSMAESLDRDMSDRKQIEAILQQRDQYQRALLDNFPFAVWLKDTESRFLTVNQGFVQLFGQHNAEELVGKNDFDIAPAELAEGYRADDRAVLAFGKKNVEEKIIDAEGTQKWFETYKAPVFDNMGSVIGTVGFARDITEKRAAVRALEEMSTALAQSSDLLQQVIDTAPIRVFWKDRECRYLGCNPAFARDAGKNVPSELIGLDDYAMGWAEQADLYRADDLHVMESGQPRLDFEEPQSTPDGKTLWLRTSKVPLRDVAGSVIGVLGIYDDITERKKAEEELRKTKDHLQAIFRVAPTGIGVVKNRALVSVNQRVCEMTGYAEEELQGKSARMLYPSQDDFDFVGQEKYRQISEKGTGKVETHWLRKDGAIIDVFMASTPLDPRDLSLGVTFTAMDITETKRTEESLRLEVQRRRILMEKSSDGIATIGPDHRVVEANQRFADMLGYSRDEVLGLYTWDYEVLMTQGQIRSSFGDLPNVSAVFETRHRRKDGSVFDVEVSVSGVLVGDQPLVFAICRDITERKRAQETLRESEARFRMLFDNISSVAVQGYDQNRAVVYWNETSTRLYGYSREEAIGQKLEDLIIPPHMRPMVIESIRALVEENTAIPAGELGLLRKDGSTIAVFSSHVMQRFSDGTSIMYCLDIDLSELSVARTELVRAKENAEAANRSKSLFLANMSHELRTPLNGVLGMLQAIRGFGVSGEVELYTEMAIRAGQRLTGLLGDILDLSRIEAGRMPITSKPFAFADIFTALAETFSPLHYSKSISLLINASPDAPAEVVGDEIRVRQILFNLVGNAMKFSDQGEVRVEVSSLLPHPSGQARLLFIISDTGLGIPDDQIDDICRPFIQVSTDFTRSHQGAGLGLSIARRLIDTMGGTLTFESTEGQGTNVYLVLPFDISEDSAIPTTLESIHSAESGASLHLLLVEDDEISRLSARLSLEKMGHQVITANNGEEALEALRGSRYDCVLMDVQMDAMDGEEATRRIRSETSGVLDAQVPIVAMTAYAMPGDRERFLEAGMDDYVSKPVQVEELKKALGRVVGTKHQE